MKNSTINFLSRLAGKHFARSYRSNRFSNPRYTLGVLDVYIGLRRMLPRATCGNHVGNHHGSAMKPWKATQGITR
jgi:hypothetical protein